MKRTLVAITLLVLAAGVFAQEAKKSEPAPNTDIATARQFKVRIFEIQNRNPQEIERAIRLLGSGFGASGLMVNEQLRTITVRDFPENIAAMEDAIKRLDRPAAAQPDVELRISVLMASKSPFPAPAALPDDLAPVVKEMQSTLRYSNYLLITSSVARPKPGTEINNEGVVEATALGLNAKGSSPAVYSYSMKHVDLTKADTRPAVTADFTFRLRFPFPTGDAVTWQEAKFETPVTIRNGEKIVVGTAMVGDKAVVVVVAATFGVEK